MSWSQYESLFKQIDEKILGKRFEQRDELLECFELLKKTIRSGKWDVAIQEKLFQIWIYNKVSYNTRVALKLNSRQDIELFIFLYKNGWLKHTKSYKGKKKGEAHDPKN